MGFLYHINTTQWLIVTGNDGGWTTAIFLIGVDVNVVPLKTWLSTLGAIDRKFLARHYMMFLQETGNEKSERISFFFRNNRVKISSIPKGKKTKLIGHLKFDLKEKKNLLFSSLISWNISLISRQTISEYFYYTSLYTFSGLGPKSVSRHVCLIIA